MATGLDAWKTLRLADTVRFAEDAIGAGAKGLMFGRNVFQQADVAAALAKLAKVVHGRA